MELKYFPRVVDKLLVEHLEAMGAVLITGLKWCGKTTTAEQQAKSVLKLQDPDNIKGYLATADTKPSLLLAGEKPRLIDEWQTAPVLWDAVRNAVDNLRQEGLFILTGSTVVEESTIMHSGTGRISRMVMYPMSLFESQESNGKISLKELFEDSDLNIDGIVSELSIEELVFAACRGGWPASLHKCSAKTMLFEAENYVSKICHFELSVAGGAKHNPARVKAVLQAYARNISTLASDKTILKDVTSNYGAISEPTLHSYINALERSYVIEDLPAWSPPIRPATVIRARMKKEFTDPSIAVAALNLSPSLLLQDMKTFGFIFECLCIRDLKVYSAALGGHLSHYLDRYGLEANCVLHLADGRYALIECKLGSKEIERGAEYLLKLKELIRKTNEEKQLNIREPELLIILTGGELAYTRNDGVKIIPIGTLKD